jgi:hypothetical protein
VLQPGFAEVKGVGHMQVDMELCEQMLRREEQLRTSPEGLQRMQMAREWLDAVDGIQRQVVSEFGLEMEKGLSLLRSATHRFPELSHLAVYVRNNHARDGPLQVGDLCANVRLLDLGAQGDIASDAVESCTDLHTVVTKARITVLCAGSFT